MPNTTAWAASSQALLVMRTATRTMAVSAAANRCPLGSTFTAGSPLSHPRLPGAVHAADTSVCDRRPGLQVRQQGRRWAEPGPAAAGPLVRQCGPGAARATQRRRDPAVVDLAPD